MTSKYFWTSTKIDVKRGKGLKSTIDGLTSRRANARSPSHSRQLSRVRATHPCLSQTCTMVCFLLMLYSHPRCTGTRHGRFGIASVLRQLVVRIAGIGGGRAAARLQTGMCRSGLRPLAKRATDRFINFFDRCASMSARPRAEWPLTPPSPTYP